MIYAFAAACEAVLRQLLHDLALAGEAVTKGKNRRAGGLCEASGQWGVVDMRMGDENVGDCFTGLKGAENRLEMILLVGARIDYGDIAFAEKVGIGSPIGHWRGVVGQHTAQIGLELLCLAWGWIKACQIIHGSSFFACATLGLGMFFGWLKHYMPRSLYGRAALILIVPIVTLQLIVSIIFIQRHFEDVSTQMTRSMAVELRLVLSQYETTGASALAAPLLIELVEGTLDQERRRWFDVAGLTVRRELFAEIEGAQAVDMPDGRALRLEVLTSRGPVVLRFDRPRVSASNPHQLLVYLIGFGLLMILIAYIYLRNQLRPIKRLAQVASAFGRGQTIEYRPSGAIEVRAAGHAFLDMRNRIERQIEQRTLMLSGVSHDLRTPLTRMKLGLSLLEEEDREPLERDVIEMQRLLDVFLSFAKGASEGEAELCDPFELVRGIVQDCERTGQDVSLGALEGEGSGQVSLRRIGVRRAVENLVGNAVRYGNRAVVSVALTDRALRIRVEDDGPGIAPQDREEALKPFARLDAARNQNQGSGVGLGLSIAMDVARAHGGILRLGESTDLGGLRADIVIAR